MPSTARPYRFGVRRRRTEDLARRHPCRRSAPVRAAGSWSQLPRRARPAGAVVPLGWGGQWSCRRRSRSNPSPPRCAAAAGVCRPGDDPGGRSRCPGAGRPQPTAAGPHDRAPSEEMCSGAGDPGIPWWRARPGRHLALPRYSATTPESAPEAAAVRRPLPRKNMPELRSCEPPTGQRSAAPRRPDPPEILVPRPGRGARAGRAASGGTRGVLRSARTRSPRWGGTRRFPCGRR